MAEIVPYGEKGHTARADVIGIIKLLCGGVFLIQQVIHRQGSRQPRSQAFAGAQIPYTIAGNALAAHAKNIIVTLAFSLDSCSDHPAAQFLIQIYAKGVLCPSHQLFAIFLVLIITNTHGRFQVPAIVSPAPAKLYAPQPGFGYAASKILGW